MSQLLLLVVLLRLLGRAPQRLEVGEVVHLREERIDVVDRHEAPDQVGDMVLGIVAGVDGFEVALEAVDARRQLEPWTSIHGSI